MDFLPTKTQGLLLTPLRPSRNAPAARIPRSRPGFGSLRLRMTQNYNDFIAFYDGISMFHVVFEPFEACFGRLRWA